MIHGRLQPRNGLDSRAESRPHSIACMRQPSHFNSHCQSGPSGSCRTRRNSIGATNRGSLALSLWRDSRLISPAVWQGFCIQNKPVPSARALPSVELRFSCGVG